MLTNIPNLTTLVVKENSMLPIERLITLWYLQQGPSDYKPPGIAKELGIGVSTAERAIARLVEMQVIAKIKSTETTTKYHIQPPTVWRLSKSDRKL